MRGPERHSKTGKNSAFQAQCNHSHICCLLGQYSGCYRCGKFLTLLLKFIAFLGGLQWVGQKKKMELKRATGIPPYRKTIAWLRCIVAESAKHMLPCVGGKTQQTKHKEPVVQEQTVYEYAHHDSMVVWLLDALHGHGRTRRTFMTEIQTYQRIWKSDLYTTLSPASLIQHAAKRQQQPPVEKTNQLTVM